MNLPIYRSLRICLPVGAVLALCSLAGVSRADLEKLDAEVSKEADAAARFALESPLPEAKEAIKYAFAGKGS